MQTILITGTAGFIGSNFVQHLIDTTDLYLICVDKITYAASQDFHSLIGNQDRFVFYKLDISDSHSIAQILHFHSPDAVINLAAETHVDRSITNISPFVSTNVNGTVSLLSSCLSYYQVLTQKKQSAFKFIQFSTDEVYGSLSKNDPEFTETSQMLPNSPYSASKAAADHFVRSFFHTYGLPTITIRPSNNYGPRQFAEKLIPLIIMKCLNEESLPIYGNGKNIRDWLFVGDTCLAAKNILMNGTPGEIYNIGSNNERQNIDIVQEICQILDKLKPRSNGESYLNLISYVTDRAGHDFRYAINCKKIKNELNWEAKVSLSLGLLETVQWYVGNPEWLNIETKNAVSNPKKTIINQIG